MNKVITINLGGNAYQLEEGGYDALRTYLETAALRLSSNPDRDEIQSDIERAIADKFRALLSSHKTVVEAKEVAAIVADMGSIDADSDETKKPDAGGSSAAGPAGEPKAKAGADGHPPRRLYRIPEGAMFAGVCNGIAAYANIDPTLVRLGFVMLTIFWGTGLMVYIVMAFVVPEACSPEEKAAASGNPATAQEFIRRAREGYYEAMKNFPDHKTRREWSRQFRRNMRANAEHWRHHWFNGWVERTPINSSMVFALPFLSLLNGVMMILFICTLISVLATGSLFGRPLPGGLPEWGVAAILVLVYGIMIGPLKQARKACYRGIGQQGWSWPIFFLLDMMIWLGVVAVLICLSVHYFPDVRDAFQSFPSLVHQAVDAIRAWWNQK
ncbi:MAG TPA: PspC domain-containing protein [Verrucomicrobiae bacterium]|jgi:phage shock protein PspC (stress-responsive transcriptional regulator)